MRSSALLPTLLPAVLGFILLLPGGSARADGGRESVELKFKELDKDRDGSVTPAELPMARIFKFLDRDGDGKVTLEEAVAAMPGGVPGAKPGGPTAPPVQPAGPHPISAAEAGIGRRVDDFTLTDLDGATRSLSQLMGKKGVVIAFTSTSCPVSKRYAPSLGRLAGELQAQEIALILVDPFASDKPEVLRAAAATLGLKSYLAHDRDGTVKSGLEARSSAEVFLLDATRTLLYRGALDDQYGLSYSKEAPEQRFLQQAVESMLAGRKVVLAATSAPGCELESLPRPASEKTMTAITYHGEVQRILQQNCAECHHEGGIGPFSLEDLDEVKDHAKVIRRVVEDGTMPPWFAVPTEPGKPSPWANDRSLAPESKRELLAWLGSRERPVGPLADAPAPVKWPQGWSLGEPDAVVAFEKPNEIKAEGTMPYVNVVVPTNFAEDRWVSAVELQPQAREVVHHIIVSVINKEEGDAARAGGKLRGEDGGAYFAVYVPGTSSERFPMGMARRLPAGSYMRFQVHYTPNGKATTDLTRLGLHFTKEVPKWEIRTSAAMNPRINIPPGDPNHMETAKLPVPPNVLVLGFFPHMHVRGKAFRYELVEADGTSRTLLDIPRYDFNWQLGYQLAEPFVSTGGTFLRATAWYDNSAANKANPDPTKTVHWGPQTYDEMMLGYVKYAVPARPPTQTAQR